MIFVLKVEKKFELSVGAVYKYICEDLGIRGTDLMMYKKQEFCQTVDDAEGKMISLIEKTDQGDKIPIIILPPHCWSQLLTKALRAAGKLNDSEQLSNISIDFENQIINVST